MTDKYKRKWHDSLSKGDSEGISKAYRKVSLYSNIAVLFVTVQMMHKYDVSVSRERR